MRSNARHRVCESVRASKSDLGFCTGHGLPGTNVFHDSMNLVLDLATPCVNRGRTWKGDFGQDLAHMVGPGQFHDQGSRCLLKLCGLDNLRHCFTSFASVICKDDVFFVVVNTGLQRCRLATPRKVKVKRSQDAGRLMRMLTALANVLESL